MWLSNKCPYLKLFNHKTHFDQAHVGLFPISFNEDIVLFVKYVNKLKRVDSLKWECLDVAGGDGQA